MTLNEAGGKGYRKILIVFSLFLLVGMAGLAIMNTHDDGAMGATTVGTIKVTSGATRSYGEVDYLLDGDIEVSGTGSRLTFTDSTITMSQDVGSDGVLGGTDDHIYHIWVQSGGELVLVNSHLTTQTSQLHPYFALDITITGSGSRLVLESSVIEAPGKITVTSQGSLVMNDSALIELQDQDDLDYDIDGDGSIDDDVDLNNDGPILTFSSGARGLVLDSEIRDTFSLSVGSRDGLIAGNITLTGSGTNFTAINSFLDIDLETNKSTGTHNYLKIQNGAIAHLVGVTINDTAKASHPAIGILDTSSRAVYYRWIGARAMDGVGFGLPGRDFTVSRIDGAQSTTMTSSYLTSDILLYMGRTTGTWSRTDEHGYALIPVPTDVFTYDSMPNSHAYPDFSISMTVDTRAIKTTTDFESYPMMAGQGDEKGMVGNFLSGEDVNPYLLVDLSDRFAFMDSYVAPTSNELFDDLDVDMTVSTTRFLKGTTSIINGTAIPSYYAFDGHLIVGSGGRLTINDTTVVFMTTDGPAYILVQNGGRLALNNVTLSRRGIHPLYVYVIGSSGTALTMSSGGLTAEHIVVRQSGEVDITSDLLASKLNMVGASTSVSVRSRDAVFSALYGKDGTMRLGGGNVSLNDLYLSGVSLTIEDAVFTKTLDLDNDATIINTTYVSSLPAGRSHWVKALGDAVVEISYRIEVQVQDSVSNPIPGAIVRALRVTSGGDVLVQSITVDERAMGELVLVQEEVVSSGSRYLGNYKLDASYGQYSSSVTSASLDDDDIDVILTIAGGPDLLVDHIYVNGALIDANPVSIFANVTNAGQFGSYPTNAVLSINGQAIGVGDVPGLGPGSSFEVEFEWTGVSGIAVMSIDIDTLQNVKETREDNNLLVSENFIGFGPDYLIEMDIGSDVWVYGEMREFTIAVTNVGEPDPEMNPFTVVSEWRKGLEHGPIGGIVSFDYIPPMGKVTRALNWTPDVAGDVMITAQVNAKFDRTPVDSFAKADIQVRTLPDLKIGAGSFMIDRPTPLTVNIPVKLGVTVLNQGELPAGPFLVSFYDGSVEETDLIAGEVAVPGIEAGGDLVVEVLWTSVNPIGSHEILVIVDPMDQVREQNETDNQMSFPVEVDSEPDLYFTSPFGLSTDSITEGRNMTFWIVVGNKGRTMAMDAEVRFTMDIPGNVIGKSRISLAPGQNSNVTLNWEAEDPGEHTIYAVVDYLLEIPEVQENNNLASRFLFVRTKADISMREEDLAIDPEGPLPLGGTVYLNATVWNLGETDAQNVIVTFYDGDPNDGGRIISWKDTQPSVNLDTVEAKKWKKASVAWIPSTGGYHDIHIVMDPLEIVKESNEDNNIMVWRVYVKTLPDLTFSQMTLYQGGFTIDSSGVGKNVLINVTLVNNGDMPAGEMAIRFYNGNPIYDDDSLSIGQENRIPAGRLGGKSSMVIEMPWTVEYPKGPREIYVEARMIGGQEQDVTNNYISTLLTVFDLEDVPELYPIEGTMELLTRYAGLDPMFTGKAFVGLNLSVFINLSNSGGRAASNTTVYFISNNGTEDRIEHMETIGFLEPDDNITVWGWWNLLTEGTNTLRIVVDPDNSIREFDEGNNHLEMSLDVMSAPDLTVRLIREGSAYDRDEDLFNLKKGKTTMVTFEVINSGNHTYSGLDVTFTGKSPEPSKTISIAPFRSTRVTFEVKPDMVYDVPVTWRCEVNGDGEHFESDTNNNDIEARFMITEEEDKGFPWLLLLIVLLVVGALIFAAVYFLVIKAQKGQMAKCSNCGGLVEIDATVCKHCGIEFSEELECECGTMIPQGAKECPSCHKPVLTVDAPEEEADGPGEEGSEEEEKTSGKTGSGPEQPDQAKEPSMEDVDEAIPDQESGLETASQESEMAECFECGAVIPISAPICPHCGAVFE